MKKTHLFTFIASISFLAFTSLHSMQKDKVPGSTTLSGDDETSSTLNNSTTLRGEKEMKQEGVDDQNLDDEHLNDDQQEDVHDSELSKNSTRFRPQCKRKRRPFDHKSIVNQFDIFFEFMDEDSYQKKDKHKTRSIRLDSASELAKMINEELEIVDHMPECIEKYVYQLQIYLKLFKLQKEDKNSSLANLSLEENIEKTIQNCEKNSQKKRISRKMSSIKQNFRQDREAALRDTSQLLKEMQPLNLERVFHLIQKADVAKDQIMDKDVILLLGGTGAGKSTTIFTLVGCTMEEQQIDNLTHIGPTHIPYKYKEHLKGVKSSPHVESQTRHIAAVPVKLSDMNVMDKRVNSVVLCDTPGFDDTAGPEVELANGKSVIEALKKARKVKLVILIPFAALEYNRMKGMRNLVHTLTKLIPSIEGHLKSLIYIFTKTTEKQEKEIDGLFKNMFEILQDPTKPESKDESFRSIFGDIKQKHKREKTIVLRPLETDTEELWTKIMDKTGFINDPESALKPFTTQKSNHALSLQITKLQTSIQEAVHAQNYELLQYKLTQLQKILQLFPENLEIKLALDESIQKVTSIWNKKCHEAYAKLQEQLNPYHTLYEKDVWAYKELLEKMKSEKGRSIQKQLSGQKNSGKKNKEGAIGYDAVKLQFRKQIENFVRKLEKTAFEDPFLLPQLEKLRTITKIFKPLRSIADKVSDELLQRIKETERHAKLNISEKKFEIFLQDYLMLYKALPVEKFLRKNPLLPETLKRLKKDLKSMFKEISRNCIRSIFQNNNEKISSNNDTKASFKALLTSYDIKQIEESINTLDAGIRCFSSQYLFTDIYAEINKYRTKLLKVIHNYIEDCQVTIKHVMQPTSGDVKSFDTMKNWYQNIERIRKIKSVRKETTAIFYRILETFNQCFRQVGGNTSKIIQTIFSGASNAEKQVKQLIQSVKCIKKTEWFDQKGGGYKSSKELLKPIEEDLLYHLQRCKRITQKMPLGIDNLTQCEQACALYCILDEMQDLGNMLPVINEPIQKIRTNIEKRIQATCRSINSSFNVKKSSLKDKQKLKKSLLRLQKANDAQASATKCFSQENIEDISSAEREITKKNIGNTENQDFLKESERGLKTTLGSRSMLPLLLKKKATSGQYSQNKKSNPSQQLHEKTEEKVGHLNDTFHETNRITMQKEANSLYHEAVSQLKKQGYEEKSIKQWLAHPKTLQQKINQLTKEIEECVEHKFNPINPRKIEQAMDFIEVCSSALCNDQLNLLFTT